MKTSGLEGTYSRTEQDEPASGKRLVSLTNQNAAPGIPPTTARVSAAEMEPKLSPMVGEAPNGTEIDPLRVIVWGGFAVVLVAVWAAILWFVGLI